MSDPQLVGIDLGTSGARITAYNMSGEIVLSDEADIERHTIDDWERALRSSALYLSSGRTICSVDGTSGTVVAVDQMGEPVFEPWMYFKPASEQTERVLDLDVTDDLAERGLSLSATSPLPKILELRDEYPDKFDNIEWILSPATWLLNRLKYEAGERWNDVRTDWTNALKFGADITRDPPKWFEPVFDAVDIPLELFPAIEAPGEYVGVAKSDLAEDIGLDGAELYQGMTDGNASVLAAGGLEPGDYNITCGSTSIVKYVSESIEPHEALYYHRHPIEGYLPGAAFETGTVLRWFCEKVFDIEESEGLKLAQRVSPGEEYEMVLQGNRSPFFDPEMGNSFFGIWPEYEIEPSKVYGRFTRGIVTGIALAEYTYIPLLETQFDTDIDSVHLVGGGTPGGNDPFSWWNKLRASIWGRETIQMEPRTTIGPLITAALSTDLFGDVEDASEVLLRSSGILERDQSVYAQYEEDRKSFADRWADVNRYYDT
jgi:xylulokinase